MTQETLREAVARIIAAELGDDFEEAFVDKTAWIDARGQSGGRFRDVNEPFQIDYLHAADAAIATMFERLRTPSEAMPICPTLPTPPKRNDVMTEKLSERVERLEGPDREVDAEIALAKGWVEYKPDWFYPPNLKVAHHRSELPHYTASLDAAMSLVPEGFVLHNLQETPTIVHEEHTGWEPLPNWQATLLRQDCAGYRNRKKFMQAFEHGGGNTAALALCAAALKARGL